jgi:hypothetical protein
MKGASYKKIHEVWAADNQEAREKIKCTEAGSFIGGVAGGAAIGVVMQRRPIARLSSRIVML